VFTKYSSILLIIFLLNIGYAAAQTQESSDLLEKTQSEAKPYRIGAGIGYTFHGYREETDLPLNRYLNTLIFIADANIEKGNFLYSLNFGILSGQNNSISLYNNEEFFTYYQRESSVLRIYLENALDYRHWGTQTFPGYIGGAIRADFYFSYLEQTIYYNITGIISLNIHATQKWIINEKNSIVFSASLPIFGYALRPPYFGLLYTPFDIEGRIVSLHNYLAFFGDIKYQYKLNTLVSLYSNLGFELSSIGFPQPRRDAAFRITTGAAFTF